MLLQGLVNQPIAPINPLKEETLCAVVKKVEIEPFQHAIRIHSLGIHVSTVSHSNDGNSLVFSAEVVENAIVTYSELEKVC